LEIADYLNAKTINFGVKLASPEAIQSAIDNDYTPLVYTVNDPHQARELQGMGVKTLFSDEPDILLENMLSVH
ncbi:MAG: glycerophosphoryl diester phosphodiesterase, partial [Pseudomonadota bacterium]